LIEGDIVVVSAPEAAVPRYIRYGWSCNRNITRFNIEGAPAFPFRTVEQSIEFTSKASTAAARQAVRQPFCTGEQPSPLPAL